MATIGAGNTTLLDLIKAQDPNGAIAKLVELMTMRTPLLEYLAFKEGNLDTGEQVSTRTGLPSIAWRKFNEGVDASKSRRDVFTETCGMLSGRSEVDVELANVGGNAPAYRASEDQGFFNAFKNEIENGLIYHSTKANPEKFMGLAPRFDATANPGGGQILLHDGSASGADQTSIWLAVTGPESVYGIFPKGSKGGISYADMGVQYTTDANGKKFRAYCGDWTWKMGLVVKDYRQVCRIANVDTGNLAATGSALIQSIVRAQEEKIYDASAGQPIIVVNRRVASYLRLQALDQSKNGTLTIETVAGKPILMLGGWPVLRTDAILNTESVVS